MPRNVKYLGMYQKYWCGGGEPRRLGEKLQQRFQDPRGLSSHVELQESKGEVERRGEQGPSRWHGRNEPAERACNAIDYGERDGKKNPGGEQLR
ncbi:MAG: hypothetical protein Q8O07_02085, partial [Chloroflexota bacterium]|nr:hypothetical protein [Chloroflexota bacterium]